MRNEAISIETEKKVAKPKIYVFNLFLFGRIETATRCVRRERIALKGETSLVAFARYLEFIYTNT